MMKVLHKVCMGPSSEPPAFVNRALTPGIHFSTRTRSNITPRSGLRVLAVLVKSTCFNSRKLHILTGRSCETAVQRIYLHSAHTHKVSGSGACSR